MTRTLPLALVLALAPAPAVATSLTDKTVNLDNPNTTPVGEVDFPFTHRFSVAGGKVSNSPTFTLSTGLTSWLELAGRYASSSDVQNFNEWELLAKGQLAPSGWPVGFTGLAGYNGGAGSIDGQLLASYDLGPISLRAAGRAFSNGYGVAGPTLAAGGGLIWHLNPLVALSGDINSVVYTTNAAGIGAQTAGGSLMPAWSGAIAVKLPYTPHSLSLYATNANTHTLEGVSRGSGTVRYGFEFMVPLSNFGRYAAWLGMGPAEAPKAPEAGPTKAVEIATFKYTPADLTIPPGTTVVFTNKDAVAHTATADDGSWDSGMIETGKTWSHAFPAKGDYPYHCAPHPFMKGTIHVK
jgi:plastocyanin